ncbi:periplasmic heavy metal sensor [Stigmatella sp. ncwal1]|uniref:Periplasmic heavy metal sensor n=1 Tax=Stigmatella ashevillensis TaxID=2995309 RepID=A0ABT5DHK4_9BACT|nr:periplasmic heavy metal sensor [Stigmatella ashevillena]MDC0712569.1 periplasmic heavy metal sensor [Stigmatella ashevillena]
MTTHRSKLLTAVLVPLLLAAPALAQQEESLVIQRGGPGLTTVQMGPGPGPGAPPLGPLPAAAHGIPPHVVEKLGVPRDTAAKIQALTFDANEALIPLEADLKRAQLQLERLLSAESPDEGGILKQVEEVGRAETAVRRNRLGLMVRIKKLLGPELWRKLEVEMGPVRVHKRIEIRKGLPDDEELGPPARRP